MADNPPPPPPNPYVAKRPTDKWRHRGVTYCRVFGQWECEMCGKKWDSGYTWVAIKKYEQNLDHEAKLVSFKLLENNVKLVKGPGHIRNLCGKCNKGAICDRAKKR
ncbi:unnamed protein product [Rhizophagus irregularis]|nr:unnamed protein product [Rhizophagus irregularis]